MLLSSLQPTFNVPATRGRMGKTDYYTETLPFGAVTKPFTFDPDRTCRPIDHEVGSFVYKARVGRPKVRDSRSSRHRLSQSVRTPLCFAATSAT